MRRLLREWWDGIREQVALIAFTSAVGILSRMARPKLEAWARTINARTDAKFGEKAQVAQRAIAEALEVIAAGLRA